MRHKELAFASDIIDTLHDAVVILQSDLTVQVANRAFFQVFDLKAAETIGRCLPDVGNGQLNSAELRALLDQVITEGTEIREFHLSFTVPLKYEQTLQLNARRLLHNDQPLVVLALENVTRQLHDQQEMVRFNAELRRSNQELEQFAFLAAHDLQAPLQTIISFLSLLMERYGPDLDKDADDFFQFTINSATHLQNMTRGLLALARVNHKPPQFGPVDCQQVLDTALGSLSAAVEACGAFISNDTLPTVLGDQAQLTQVFQNLLDNAIKFRGEKPPEIHVSVEEREHEWVFSIQDDGVGIEPEYIGSIFELFRRAHTQKEFEGSGIGLAIAKRIVEQHGGRIWVETTQGKLTIFYFSIAKQPDTGK